MISGSCSTPGPHARHMRQPAQFDSSDDAGRAAGACRLQQASGVPCIPILPGCVCAPAPPCYQMAAGMQHARLA